MVINRDIYLRKLIASRHNGMIKIVTGVRRCGKSFLLSTIYANWLRGQGVDEAHIVTIDLEDRRNKRLRDPDALLEYIDSKIQDNSVHYIMIDEIQHVSEFEDVLNSYLKMPKRRCLCNREQCAIFFRRMFVTTFRGRGEEIRLYPLSFREVYPFNVKICSKDRALTNLYALWGIASSGVKKFG